ncbi:MAG TPA: hypothetical protein VEI01_04835 [Terriglobales bacterium]|nr:hypothetical protein [Terriglobales bacterium]
MVSLLSGWMQQGVESFFATQRILVDLAMRQNANVMKVLRERLTDPHHSPANIVAEMAGEGMANFIEAQKVLLHLAQEQNDIVLTGVRERVGSFVPAGAVTDLWRRSIDTFITMQQEFLKIAGRQTHAWLEVARTGKPYRGDRLMELAREGMERFIHAQKQFLDIIEDETAKATGAKRTNGAAARLKKTELSELANRATEAFVDAQKKLFDLAGRQINANVKAAGRAADLLKPLPFVDLADLTREGVRSYVDAQKALMDVMLKPRNAHKREAQPERRRRRPRFIKGEVVPRVRAAAV